MVTVYVAVGLQTVGQSAGYSRRGGKYTEAHDQIKRMLVRPLRRDARRILCQRGDLASHWQKKGRVNGHSLPALRSLHDDLSWMRVFVAVRDRSTRLRVRFQH